MEALVPFAAAVFLAALAFYFGLLGFRELVSARVAGATIEAEHALLRERIAEIADRRRREREKAERTWDGFRKFVIARKVIEGKDICSFYFEPHDRRPLPLFQPGQFLTFRLPIPGQPKPVIRCYSLSDAPRPDYFRCTIKRIGPPPGKPDGAPGLASSYFHDELSEGDVIDVKAPGGAFFLEPSDTAPAVLIGGGIGLTPVMSMLNAIVDANARREVWFFYGVRNKSEHVMAEHLREIAANNPNVSLNICYSDPTPEDREGHDFQHKERVSIDLFKRVLPSKDVHYYLCGPPPMMQSLVEGLEGWGVPHSNIHYEAFGPASVKSTAAAHTVAGVGAKKFNVSFAHSQKKTVWDGKATILEIAEANGVKLDFGCRAGNCGTCLTAIKTGEVEYPSPPGATPEAGSCLACVAVPKSDIEVIA